MLAAVSFEAAEADVNALSRAHGQMVGATAPEIEAATVAVLAALEHAVIRRARAAGAACRREAPVLLRCEDGLIVEGVLDLAFREDGEAGGEWVVVDYKTDADLTERQEDYERQVRLYARAVTAATGERARGVLLRV